MGEKRKSAFIIKKEEIHSSYAVMQEKLCGALKAIQPAHNGRNYFIAGITFHVHALLLYISAYYSISFYSLTAC